MDTAPDDPANHIAAECARARAWRDRKGWSRAHLSALTGYSPRQIVRIEAGQTTREDLHTYRMACAAAAAGITFDWDEPRAWVTESRLATLG